MGSFLILKKKFYSLEFFLFINLINQLFSHKIYKSTTFSKEGSYTTDHFLIGLFLLIVVVKLKQEGARFSIFIAFLSEISLLFTKIVFKNNIYALCFSFFLVILYLFTNFYFFLFELPNPTGPYPVGYREISFGEFKYSLFYPCENNFTKNEPKVNWVDNLGFELLLHHIETIVPFVPDEMLKFILSFISKIDIEYLHYEAKIIKDSTIPFCIFVPGLGAYRNNFSVFTSELASYGYFVICTQYRDRVKLTEEEKKIALTIRKKELEERVKSVKSVIDRVNEKDFFNSIFGDSVQIELSKINIIGHSFGGITAIQAGIEDNRINGAIIALDPWFTPSEKENCKKDLKKPLLCIFNQEFLKREKENEEYFELLFHQNSLKKRSVGCILKNGVHLHQCDIFCAMPRECNLLGILPNLQKLNFFFEINRKLILEFLNEVIYKEKEGQLIRSKINERFNNDEEEFKFID